MEKKYQKYTLYLKLNFLRMTEPAQTGTHSVITEVITVRVRILLLIIVESLRILFWNTVRG